MTKLKYNSVALIESDVMAEIFEYLIKGKASFLKEIKIGTVKKTKIYNDMDVIF